MKLLCDVCNKTAASVICCADEAALCDDCDHKVHRANKVASKHLRFSLSESTDLHLCDICKEKGGYFVFCQEDRTILCWNCDDSVHSANKLTMKHSRFLLTGTRISAVSSVENSCSSNNKLMKSSQEKINQISHGASSISEYLIKTIPGYCVEDLLDFNVPYKNDVIRSEAEERTEVQCPVWVPHIAPQVQLSNYTHNDFNSLFSLHYIDLKYNQNENELTNEASLVESQGEDSYMVPELNAPVLENKRRYKPSSGWY